MHRKIFSGKLLQRMWRKLGQELGATSSSGTYTYENVMKSGAPVPIPKDVPKGHMVVYVGEGEQLSRYVIKISFLEHPLFQELLELAHQEYGFAGASGICIPCDEQVFLRVISYLDKLHHQHQILFGCCLPIIL